MKDEDGKKIEEIMAEMLCPKNFKCAETGFQRLCKAKDNGLEHHVECLEENFSSCFFASSFGDGPICRCPLRVYICKNVETKSSDDWFERATTKFSLDDYQGAIADLTKAIELKPDYAEAYAKRGTAKHQLIDYKGAIADLTKAIELKPDYAKAYYNRGLDWLALDQMRKAQADLKKAIELGFLVPQVVLESASRRERV